jgi:hypothetical protein
MNVYGRVGCRFTGANHGTGVLHVAGRGRRIRQVQHSGRANGGQVGGSDDARRDARRGGMRTITEAQSAHRPSQNMT